jgi:hypothetical protein
VLDPVKNGLIKVENPSTMVYLGYGFSQPKPGRWVVTLISTETTPPAGADYAIMAVFDGGATLTAQIDKTVPALTETVIATASLTADGEPVAIQGAQAILRRPDGSAETLAMNVNGNSAVLGIDPASRGIYGIEVIVTAQASDGTLIDRAAFLSFEAQPAAGQFAKTYLLIGVFAICVIVLAVIILALQLRKKFSG